MAELEAVYENREEGLRYGWRYALPNRQVLRLGRLPTESDWTMNDGLISGFHASIEWDPDKAELSVRQREPKPPKNKIYFRGVEQKQFTVPVGESFIIGHTKFTVHRDAGQATTTPADGTMIQREQTFSRSDLSNLPFQNPSPILRALERVPEVLRVASNEELLFGEMLKVVLEAIPRADSAAIVFIPPETPLGELRVGVRDTKQRLSAGADTFVPSRRLVDRALRQQMRSILYVWDPGSTFGLPGKTSAGVKEYEMTLAPSHKHGGGTPWAICTPFLDASGYGLYVAGRSPVRPGKDRQAELDLTEYQKVVELIVSLIESTRKSHKLERQNALIMKAWPRRAWGLLDDPEKLEQLLEPQEMDVTVLFCDLRNFGKFAEQGKTTLLEAWRQLSMALDEMSRTITDHDGVVAGFQGDAVMGFWGWPEPQERQVELAARAALRIHDRFAGVLKEFKCGLGLAHGRAVAGRLGSHDLAKVDVYGHVVNLASRLEGLTKAFGVNILVNETVADELRAADPAGKRYRIRKLAKLRPKSMQDAVLAFELFPPIGAVAQQMNPARQQWWDQAVDWFLEGKWKESHERLSQFFNHDGAGKLLMERMERSDRIPPEGWDGVIVFTTKE